MVKNLVKAYWPTGLGVAVGALGGWLYYFYIGCHDGTCPITSVAPDERAVGRPDGRFIVQLVSETGEEINTVLRGWDVNRIVCRGIIPSWFMIHCFKGYE